MPLSAALPQFKIDIKAAFEETTWQECAVSFAGAIDTFVKAGLVVTVVSAIVVPPLPAPPYPAVGTGTMDMTIPKGLITTNSAPMMSAFDAIFKSITWVGVGTTIANAILTFISMITLQTDVTGIIIGTGTGIPGCIVPTISAVFIPSMEALFISSSDWTSIVDSISQNILNLLTTAVVTTIDSGVIPPNSWAGAGVGTIS